MALAKKCDRCEKLYEHYPKGNKVEYNGVQRISLADNGGTVTLGYKKDLCPECMAAFDKFMISGGKFDD